MAVLIKVDQAAKPAGVPGQAREDLATGVGVTLTAVGGPYLQYQWAIVSKPIDITVPAFASSLLGSPSANVTTLSPIDVAGTYLVEVAVDSGSGLGAGEDDVASITFYAGPTLASDPVLLPRRKMAAFERLQHNVPDALQPLGNTEGWSREWYRWFALLEHVWAGKGWASGRVSDVGVVARSFNLVTPVNVAAGPVYQVRFLTPAPDADYLPLVTSIVPAPGNNAAPTVDNVTVNGFDVHFVDETATPANSGFAFVVNLGE